MATPLIRAAREEDLAAIVGLFCQDALTAPHERCPEGLAAPAPYVEALGAIDRDPNAHLMVAELDGQVVGTFQLNLLTYMHFRGATVAQIEAVYVHTACRGRGTGRAMMEWAIAEARRLGCHRVQLTTNKLRHDAHRFYRRLGFQATHEGMKLWLEGEDSSR